jgi:GH35 family endo-1,4-beta-xylanase
MNEYRHHVSGFFSNRSAAERALSTLVERGLRREQLQISEIDMTGGAPDAKKKTGWLSALVGATIANEQIVLVVLARAAQETVIARDVMQESVCDYKE